MSSPVKQATIVDKLMCVPLLVGTFVAMIRQCWTLAAAQRRPEKPFKSVAFASLRHLLGNISIAQEQWTLAASTQDVYLAFAQKKKFRPESTELNSGLRLHWLGPKTAEKVILFFHGGGYAMPCSDGHIKWIYDLQQDLSKIRSTSVILAGYTLTPHATYPGQLKQAAEALKWLVGKHGKKPSDIIVMGDSAGGNMSLSLLSHLIHPHPEATKITLSEPLAGAVLISPWISFSTMEDSWKRNLQTDMLAPGASKRWSSMFLGTKKSDEYNEPINADETWFKGLDRVVKGVLVWGGSEEVLIDSVQAIGKKLKQAHSGVEVIVTAGAHDDFILDAMLGYAEKHEGTKLIESWIAERI